MCIRVQKGHTYTLVKDRVVHVRVRWNLIGKRQNNPECTYSISLHNVEVEHYAKEKYNLSAEDASGHQNNPVCTYSIRVFIMLKLDTRPM